LLVYFLSSDFNSSCTSGLVKSSLLNSNLKVSHFQLTVDRVVSIVILSAMPPISSSVK